MRAAGPVDHHGRRIGGSTRLDFAILAGCLLSFALYRVRARRVERLLAIRSEERLAERDRIRQELHDTLLQGLLAVSMQLQLAADALPADSLARPHFERALAMLRQVVDEGKTAVRGLRSPGTDTHELEAAFSGVRDEFADAASIDFRVVVDGKSRPLSPLIRDEVYRIGRAALANAFRHSGSPSVEMQIGYRAKLRVAVRDEGRGLDTRLLGSELIAMRDRAEEIGAKFQVRSRRKAGTEVVLTVPGHIAFPPDDNPNDF
jgi:signal transduction histidine kinase